MPSKIIKGDRVIVLNGKDKGRLEKSLKFLLNLTELLLLE